uniref:Uncharacterized protein n=1 Tax=Mus spicilegus TaxID=10103 RepID=A0A8C6II30_MUSSI
GPLFPVMFLRQTQKEPTMSADREKNLKAVVDKIDCQSERNIKDTIEQKLCVSHQNQTLFEDLGNATTNKLNLSTFVSALSKCCTQKNQVNPVNLRKMDHRFQGTKLRHQQDNYTSTETYWNEFLNLVSHMLNSKYR